MKIIKTIPFQLISLTLCLLFTWSSCSENKIIEQEYLEVSLSTYTFDATSPEELVIQVKANPTWSTNLEHAAWFSVAERGDDYLIIRAQNNTSIYPRVAYLELSSGIHTKYIYVSQLGKKAPSAQFLTFPQFSKTAISPDGHYFAGTLALQNNMGDVTSYLFKIDMRTGEQYQIDMSKECAIGLYQVSNTGLVTASKGGVVGFYAPSGEWNKMQLPVGAETPSITGMSTDGKVVVGFVSYKRRFTPVVWHDNQVTILPVPEFDIYGDVFNEGLCARGCSSDGNIIYGFGEVSGVLVYWKDGEVHYAGTDIFKLDEVIMPTPIGDILVPHIDRLLSETECYGISPNGRYLAAYLSESQPDKRQAFFPAVYDIEEQKTFVVRDLANYNGSRDGQAIGVTNDMDIFYNQSEILNEFPYIALPVYGYVYDAKLGKSLTTAEYIKNETGLSLAIPTYMVYRKCSDEETFYGSNSLDGIGGRIFVDWVIRPRI